MRLSIMLRCDSRMKNTGRLNKKIIFNAIISLLILGIAFCNTGNATVPFIFNDEYGYWSNAAWLAGYDWSSTTSEISWYSFGYSFILAIIIFITKDFFVAYRIAILFNCVLLALSYVLLYVISLRFTNKNNVICAIIPVVYCSNWINKNYAWPEILLCFLFVLITFFVIKICETKRVSWYVLLSICLVFMYMVHMRTISIILASGIFLFIISRKEKKAYMYFLLIVLVGIILQVLLKKYFTTNLWQNSVESNSNGYASIIPSSVSEITIGLFINIINSFLGKVFYIIAATMGLIVFATQNVIYNLKIILKERELKRDIIFYTFLCLVLSIGVASVFSRSPQYTTHLLYGRYTEYTLAPIILISTILLLEERRCCRNSIHIGIIISCILGLIITKIIEKTELAQVNIPINSVGLSVFYMDGKINLYYVVLLYSILNYLILMMKKNYKKYQSIILLPLVILWFVIGQNAYNGQEAWSNNIISKEEIAKLCAEIDKDLEREIYMYRGSSYWNSHACAEIIQFYYPNKEIQYVDAEEFDSVNNGIVFCIKSDYKKDIQDKLYKQNMQVYLVDK